MTINTIHDLETPSVLIDVDRMTANINRMQAYCNAHGLAFRAHIKTHKIPEIAQLQIDAGAVGIACQKLSEARIFIESGFRDIQIPYNIVGPQKTAHLADMALYNRIVVSADHPYVVGGLADAARANEISLRVMVDLATEIERTGAAPAQVIELAKRIDSEDHLHFAGILVYPSNPSIRPVLQEVLDGLHRAGIGVDSVSGGGTGAALTAHELTELTELRVGTYIFNDWTTVKQGWASLEDCAMTVLATVVSRPAPYRAILDCGSKTLTSEIFDHGYGHILEYPNAKIYRLNEEHAYIDLTDCDDTPVIGERVRVVPVHTCVVTNMHDTIYGIQGESVTEAWTVGARGKVW